MNVDIETYSDVDIKASGAYVYAESPAFEILLIAYKLDDGPINVIDLTKMFLSYGNHSCGKLISGIQKESLRENYRDFWDALIDPEYVKTAYNANFERTCLAAYFDIGMSK